MSFQAAKSAPALSWTSWFISYLARLNDLTAGNVQDCKVHASDNAMKIKATASPGNHTSYAQGAICRASRSEPRVTNPQATALPACDRRRGREVVSMPSCILAAYLVYISSVAVKIEGKLAVQSCLVEVEHGELWLPYAIKLR